MSSKESSKDKKKPELLHAEKEFYVLEITNLNRTIARQDQAKQKLGLRCLN